MTRTDTGASLYNPSEMTVWANVDGVPNVVFPVAALCDAPTGRIAIYYGAADTVVVMAFTQADEVVEFIKTHQEYFKD